MTNGSTNNPKMALNSSSPPILSAAGVSRFFRMGESTVRVLHDAGISVREGEFVAIEGRSGSGKSTLLHVLGGLDVADAGRVHFDGRDYTRRPAAPGVVAKVMTNAWVWRGWMVMLLATPVLFMTWWVRLNMGLSTRPVLIAAIVCAALLGLLSLAYYLPKLVTWFAAIPGEWRAARMRNRDFGFVFQFYHLLPELNVLENVLITSMVQHSWFAYLSKRTQLRQRARHILTELGMEHRLTHRPQQLSGGERQRVAIARALMNRPRVLFADEPTGNLDFETGRQIMAVLEKLHQQQKQTIIMVTHDRSLARQADRVMVLKNGRLEEVVSSQ